MVRVLNKFNRKKNPYVDAHGVNPEGFPSFQRSDKEAYLQVLLTNTLTGTFYASESTLLKESLALHAQMTTQEAEFAARALVYARNEGLMRLQPIVGLAYLAKADLSLFHAAFPQVIRTPGDLSDFVEIVRGEVVPGGMGRSIKRAINNWMNGMSEYHAIKYAAGGQGYSLRDILRLAHPKPVNATQDALFLWLMDKDKWAEKAATTPQESPTPQVAAFESLKRLSGADSASEARALIEAGRLPYEVVTGIIKPDADTWRYLMRQMPYMALLRHLNTLQRAGILASEAAYVAERLSNEAAVLKSKILPFQFFTAYRMFKPSDPAETQIRDALAAALDISFANLPPLEGRVCIAPDVSGSMSGLISRGNAARFIDIAGIFAAALLKGSLSALVMPFDTAVHEVMLNRRDSLMTNAGKLAALLGGGTAVSAPISKLLADKRKVDTFIGITDNVEWATDAHGNTGFLPTWMQYKEKVAPNARAFLVTIAPYRHAVAPQETRDLHYIYGWSDSVLKYISMTAGGLGGQVQAVESMAI